MSDLTALFDAFAAVAPCHASLNLPASACVADALLHWSIERGYGAETRELERSGWQWKCVTVTLPNQAYVSAHREGHRVHQPAEVAHG